MISPARRHARRILRTASDELTRVVVNASTTGALVGIGCVIAHWR